jgi:hypothetical protein
VQVLIEEVKLINDKIYRDWIKEAGTRLLSRVKEAGATDYKKDQFSFGLAAKIINIYIKTVWRCCPQPEGQNYLRLPIHPLMGFCLGSLMWKISPISLPHGPISKWVKV